VLAEFQQHQETLLRLLSRAAHTNLNRKAIPSEFFHLLKLRLGEAFLFVIAHQERHMQQAQRAHQQYQAQPTDELLQDIQKNIYRKALNYRESHTTRVDTYEEFKQVLEGKGGFVVAHYDGTSETEERIKEETKATIRCLALNEPDEEGICILTGKPSQRRAYFAKAY
jgi:hypothetical protein